MVVYNNINTNLFTMFDSNEISHQELHFVVCNDITLKSRQFTTTISLVPRPLFFCFYLVTAKKRVWWNSIGRFVLLTPRFWELLIGVNNYKGHPLNDVPVACAFDFCTRDKGKSLSGWPL